MIAFADVTGDSFLLARRGAAATEAELVVFLGVYFMAEAADVLRAPAPDGRAARTSAPAATWPSAPTSTRCATRGTR